MGTGIAISPVVGGACDGALLAGGLCGAAARDGDDLALACLLDIEPGPVAMAMLGGIDPSTLDDAGRVTYLQAWDRQNAWVTAQIAAATVAFAGAAESSTDDVARAEFAVAMKMSGRAAQQRIYVARMLTQSLPTTLAMLESGELPVRHAMAMVELCAPVPDDGLHLIEKWVLPKVPNQSLAAFRRSVRRAILRFMPADVQEAHELARKQRDVVIVPEPNGMATVIATLTATEARSLFLAVDALARGRHQAEGGRKSDVGIGTRRADALVALADEALASRQLPTSHGRPAELQVVIDLATLLHLAHKPAELIGYGPLPPEIVRDLAADANWRRLVTDPVTGHLLDYGRSVYRPPQALADYLDARDRFCRIPGCNRLADRCDHDHVVPFDSGGDTSSDNCIALCRRHHGLKTKKIWQLKPGRGGHATLTTANGITYQLHPPDQRDM
jgi:hypothetical protein